MLILIKKPTQSYTLSRFLKIYGIIFSTLPVSFHQLNVLRQHIYQL
jgi:hypothetical protein